MSKTRIIVDGEFRGGEISPAVFGSFVEHMGRVVYSGIYEPEHPLADQDGFRTDVLKKVNEMGVSAIRYPGGNFVSNYNWLDGVGPRDQRPRKREVAWKSIETNQFGTDEFMHWISHTGAEPIFAVNLGTKGVENALSLLEYINLPTGTFYSDLRAKNGHPKPYGVRKWCLGNEMDGIWQIGHKTAEEYGRLAAQTAHAMKALDDSIELIACGSSSTSMHTYTDWERIVLEDTYEFVDYIALHQYYGNQEYGSADFLAQSLDMDNYIETVAGICRTVKSKKRGRKDIKISIDEWGVWEIPGDDVAQSVSSRDWKVAPAFSEQIYTMEDALLFSSMLMSMMRHADVVKIACQSLLTNISAAIMTERGGTSWVQPIFYPFLYMSRYGRGRILEQRVYGDCYESRFGQASVIDAVLMVNEEAGECISFLVNRTDQIQNVEISCQQLPLCRVLEHIQLSHPNLKQTNQIDHRAVKPVNAGKFTLSGNIIKGTVEPFSWNMVRVAVDKRGE